MYRIYINQSVLIISKYAPEPIQNHQMVEIKHCDIKQLYERSLLKTNVCAFFMVTDNIKEVFQKIKESLKTIQAAGGLVQNEKYQYLFIFRKGKWDLPKGKLELGEEIKDTAHREVEEECGIQLQEVGDVLGTTYHIYKENNELILKETVWYNMLATHQDNLTPQVEEDITDARWLSVDDLRLVKQNTYPLIEEIIDRAIENK